MILELSVRYDHNAIYNRLKKLIQSMAFERRLTLLHNIIQFQSVAAWLMFINSVKKKSPRFSIDKFQSIIVFLLSPRTNGSDLNQSKWIILMCNGFPAFYPSNTGPIPTISTSTTCSQIASRPRSLSADTHQGHLSTSGEGTVEWTWLSTSMDCGCYGGILGITNEYMHRKLIMTS